MSKSEPKTLAEVFLPIDESFETEDGGMDEQQQSCNLSVGGESGYQKPQRYRPSASIIDRRGNLPLRVQFAYASGPFTPPVFQPYADLPKEAQIPTIAVVPVAVKVAPPKPPRKEPATERDSFTAKVIRSPSKMSTVSKMTKTAQPIPI